MSNQKVLNLGDVYYFYELEEDSENYVVSDYGLYMMDSGNWCFCIEFMQGLEKHLVQYFIFKDLLNAGLIWKHGNEKIALKLREIDEKRKELKLRNY
jgi:hypothetical protein